MFFSYTLAVEIKAELERLATPAKEIDETIAAITKKMASRVQTYETTFRGTISPQSLLVRGPLDDLSGVRQSN